MLEQPNKVLLISFDRLFLSEDQVSLLLDESVILLLKCALNEDLRLDELLVHDLLRNIKRASLSLRSGIWLFFLSQVELFHEHLDNLLEQGRASDLCFSYCLLESLVDLLELVVFRHQLRAEILGSASFGTHFSKLEVEHILVWLLLGNGLELLS